MDPEAAALHAPDPGQRAPGASAAAGRGLDVDEINSALRDQSPEAVVRWAAKLFGNRLAVSSSFGAHSAAMLHLVTSVVPDIPVIFIDTGYLFEETYRFAAELEQRFSLNLHVFSPTITAARQEALHGKLWEDGDDGVRQYLATNKVEPMQRALRSLGVNAWMAGLRASQTEHRSRLPKVAMQDGRIKIHPILDWTSAQVDAYLAAHDLPHHPLYRVGYRSIGDWHSTEPVAPDEDERAGRLLGVKRECGLHLALSDPENRSLTSSRL
jgi:phosphoadenosine phosphosulfate reductase